VKNNKAIIVKKIKKQHGGGHHGGAWKVAYADFVTAMMAFFLLLWLLSMVSDEKRARLSAYFKYFSIYESGGTSWMDKSSEIFGESGENKQKVFVDMQGDTITNADSFQVSLKNMGKALDEDLAKKLGDTKDQVIVDVADEGIRIQMIDKEGSLMFKQGSKKLTKKAKDILRLICEDIRHLPNKVIIEGHTDSLPYAGRGYSNWELSTERASSARQELEDSGLDPDRIIRVAGYADTDPLIKDNTKDPRNRRISITLSVLKGDPALVTATHNANTQIKNTSKEFISVLSDETILSEDKRVNLNALPGSSYNAEKNKPVDTQNDYDSIINEGQWKLKNGQSITKSKDTIERNDQSSDMDDKGKTQTVIKELSKPSIVNGDMFHKSQEKIISLPEGF
jgi:chemotaxis protein MotB